MEKRSDVATDLIDVRELKMTSQDAGQASQDPAYRDKVVRADALVVVAPEYNHGYPGALKQALDMCLEEYIHKAVGICGVSAGPFGGTRVIENLLPVMRELGLVTTFTDINFSNVGKVFGEDGGLLDDSYIRRANAFLDELIWMARVLRHGRENIGPA
jgi:NAD(P)H-dependent FMN reductase